MNNSFYDIRPAVLHGDRKNGTLQRVADSMADAVQSCESPFPKNGVCMVTAGSPRSYKDAVETLAGYFVRELGYDFRPYTAAEYSNRIYRPPLERTNNNNTRSFLWFSTHEGNPGHWATFGACTFRLGHDAWVLKWVWMHPYERRKGHLTRAWPFFRSMFGLFLPEPPFSPGIVAFLRKRKYSEILDSDKRRKKAQGRRNRT